MGVSRRGRVADAGLFKGRRLCGGREKRSGMRRGGHLISCEARGGREEADSGVTPAPACRSALKRGTI